jgi:phosphoadenosine phosphosulfate reductase
MAQTINELVRPGPSAPEYDRVEATAVRLEGSAPEEVLRWAFDEFEDRVSIATGFGLEGVALIDLAVKINPRADIFFLDTSFLFPETYALRRRLEAHYRVEIRGLRSEITPEAQEQSFGPQLWSTDPDLCCRLRKLEPLREELSGRAAWVTAIRRDQTPARAASRVVEWDRRWGLVKVNPLAGWSRSDVWSYVRKMKCLTTRSTSRVTRASAVRTARARSAKAKTSARAAGRASRRRNAGSTAGRRSENK